MGRNFLYAQSGGVTAVINATAAAVIEAARERGGQVGKVLAARDGIVGVLEEHLVDTSKLKKSVIAAMNHTPGGLFGSCRFKLDDPEDNPRQYERLFEVFRAHDIGSFFYNGGNDSADTALKLARVARKLDFPLQCIAIPKTIDNDLVMTDNCPGFGSVAKYVAVSTLEAGLDVRSMARTSTKVFILEVMGRHAGWIAAASGLAASDRNQPPHLILMPEVTFDEAAFCQAVDHSVKRNGYCVVVVSEGVRDQQGRFLAEAGDADAFGHRQLGGVAPAIAGLIGERLALKCHWAVSDYLQRSARHIASKTDLEQARAVGKAAVELAIRGESGVMPVIRRLSDQPYQWTIDSAPLARIANREKKVPKRFIRSDGFGITSSARAYLAPLIRGEAFPPHGRDGLPRYLSIELASMKRKLPGYEAR